MAVIKKDGNFMGLPMNIARGNPIPLDTTAVWYSYNEMAEYAKNGVTAYVGQILACVDEDNLKSTAYIILNAAGDLQEVGSATLGDNKTLVLEDGILGLKDFGDKYYRYVPEAEGEDGEKIPAHYELQEVDAEHPWAAGLEPKVVSENGQLVLGWYEPNPTTIEGVNSQVSGIQTTVKDLQDVTNDLQSDVADLEEKIGHKADGVEAEATGLYKELEEKANKEDVYTKQEVKDEIAAAIADVDHLSKTVVDSKNNIDVNADNADKFIYLVPMADGEHEEYMIINGKLELVGTTKVDLSDYATLTQLDGKVDKVDGFGLVSNANIEKLEAIEAGAQANKIEEVDEEIFVLEDKTLSLKEVPISKISGLQDQLDKIPSSEDLNKFTNVIEGVNEEQFTIAEGKILNLKPLTIDSIEDLNQALNSKVSAEEGKGLSTNDLTDELLSEIQSIAGIEASVEDIINSLDGYKNEEGEEVPGLKSTVATLVQDLDSLEGTVGSFEETINGLTQTFDNYVLQTTFDSTVGSLTDLKTEKKENLVEAINELNDRLTWEELQ